MNVKNLIEMDLKCQEKLLERYNNVIQTLPKGRLYGGKSKGKTTYYVIDSETGKRKYLGIKSKQIIDGLKRRKYMELACKIMKDNIEVEKKFLKKYEPYDYKHITQSLPLIYSFETKKHASRHETKKFSDEVLHETTRGLMVRSKSEAIIAEMLYADKIDFIYEQEIELYHNGKLMQFRPDFTFRNGIGEEFYLEHFGMLSNSTYRDNTVSKLLIYIENGILPGRNLFITADSLDGELDLRSIMSTIQVIKGYL